MLGYSAADPSSLHEASYGNDGTGYGAGGYNNASRSPSPFMRPSSSNSHNSAYASQRQAEDLEGQNDEEIEGLGAKVKMLKDVSLNAGQAEYASLSLILDTDHH